MTKVWNGDISLPAQSRGLSRTFKEPWMQALTSQVLEEVSLPWMQALTAQALEEVSLPWMQALTAQTLDELSLITLNAGTDCSCFRGSLISLTAGTDCSCNKIDLFIYLFIYLEEVSFPWLQALTAHACTEKRTWYKLSHSGESSTFRVMIHK